MLILKNQKLLKKSKKSDDKEKTEETNEKKEKSGQQNLEVKNQRTKSKSLQLQGLSKP